MKQDFNRIMEDQISSACGSEKPSLLLHSCCAPCTSSVLERLHDHFQITLFYYNPNTYPQEEYDKRGAELPKLLKASGMEDVRIIYGEYNQELFFRYARGYETEPEGGARCEQCFNMRLRETADLASRLGFDMFCTTLTVSPYKNAALINEIGKGLEKPGGPLWLFSDFKKKNGYLRSIELSREYGIYRQCYCGCAFSLRPGSPEPH